MGGEFEFKRITCSDYPAVIKHMVEVFCKTEPLLSCLGYTVELRNDYCKMVESDLKISQKHGLSFIAIHKPSQKIAGVRITTKASLEDHDEEESDFTYSSIPMQKAMNYIEEVAKNFNIFNLYSVNHYADLQAASVDPEFRNRGLEEMYKRTLKLLKSRKYPLVKCVFSSPITRKVAIKLGFEEINRNYFKDFKDSNGDAIVENAGDDQYGALMVLRLTN